MIRDFGRCSGECGNSVNEVGLWVRGLALAERSSRPSVAATTVPKKCYRIALFLCGLAKLMCKSVLLLLKLGGPQSGINCRTNSSARQKWLTYGKPRRVVEKYREGYSKI